MDARSAILGLSHAHKKATTASSITVEKNVAHSKTIASSANVSDSEYASNAVGETPKRRAPFGQSTASNVEHHNVLMANRSAVKSRDASGQNKQVLRTLNGGVPVSAATPTRPGKPPPPPPSRSGLQFPAPGQFNGDNAQSIPKSNVVEINDTNRNENDSRDAADLVAQTQAAEIEALRRERDAVQAENAMLTKRVTDGEALLISEKTKYSELESNHQSLKMEYRDREAALNKRADEEAANNGKLQAKLEQVTRIRDTLQIMYDDILQYLQEVVGEQSELLQFASQLRNDVGVAFGLPI